jgi:hypothetical protein
MGVEANSRLTSSTALVLVILLAIEGVTILQVRSLLTPHVFVGMLLIPPIVVKIASTVWRFANYYLGRVDYQRKGPPPAALRVLGPFVVILTVVLFGTGVLLLLGPYSLRGQLLQLHQVSFVLWFLAMTVHVLSHLTETAKHSTKDWSRRARRQVSGSLSRRIVLASSLVAGLVLAFITIPYVGPWLGGAG